MNLIESIDVLLLEARTSWRGIRAKAVEVKKNENGVMQVHWKLSPPVEAEIYDGGMLTRKFEFVVSSTAGGETMIFASDDKGNIIDEIEQLRGIKDYDTAFRKLGVKVDDSAVRKSGEKITVYLSHPMTGAIMKKEGRLISYDKDGIKFVPKRARNVRRVDSYNTGFWMLVKGWGKPDPEQGEVELKNDDEARVTTYKYRAGDDRWAGDFVKGAGKRLKPIAVWRDGKLKT